MTQEFYSIENIRYDNKIDVNEIDFSKLNKLDVESSENTVYLDDKDEKIYKIFLSKDLDLSKKKEENFHS